MLPGRRSPRLRHLPLGLALSPRGPGSSFPQWRCASPDAALPLVVVLAELHASVTPLRLAAAGVERAIRLGPPLAGEGVVGDFDRARIVRVRMHSSPLAFGRAARHAILLLLAGAAAELAVRRGPGFPGNARARPHSLARLGFRAATVAVAGPVGPCRIDVEGELLSTISSLHCPPQRSQVTPSLVPSIRQTRLRTAAHGTFGSDARFEQS